MSEISKERASLNYKMWLIMIKIAFIFGIPAGIGYFIGKYLDERFAMRPNGTLIVLFVTFILSWTMTVLEYKKIARQFKELDEKEEQEKLALKNTNKENKL